jgi:dCTP deaminase
MTILRAERIAEFLRRGHNAPDPLVMTPTPDLGKLETSGSASVDLRLGTWFVSLRPARMTHFSADDKRKGTAQLTKTHYVPFGVEYILHPSSFVLGVTLEWIRLPSNLAAYVVGRSSWGRRGLIIATATGVHPGFVGCLTLELSNVGEIPIGIKPGMTICQLFIHTVEGSGSHATDQSNFVGLRKPTVGRIALDEFALRLEQS